MTPIARFIGTLGAGALLTAILIAEPTSTYFNTSPSAPAGEYLVDSTPIGEVYDLLTGADRHPLRVGDRILTCMTPAIVRYFNAHGFPDHPDPNSWCPEKLEPVFVKSVFALPGAHVHIADAGIYVDGHLLPHTMPLKYAPDGAPLPRPTDFIVPPGNVVAGSTLRTSFDSRYAGPLPVRARVTLLFPDPFVHESTNATASADTRTAQTR